jgi:uncharacterized protein
LVATMCGRLRKLPVEYCRIETGGRRGGLLPRPAKAPLAERGTNAFVVPFEVPDFDVTAKKIADNGGRIALPKFAVAVVWAGCRCLSSRCLG